MKYVTITKAKVRQPSMWTKTTPKDCQDVPIIAIVNIGAFDSEDLELKQEKRISAYLTSDGKLHCGYTLCITPLEMHAATKAEVFKFISALTDNNLCVRQVMLPFNGPNQKPYWRICYKDPEKAILSLPGREYVMLKDAHSITPPEGTSFAYTYDNGYSYYGCDPTTKEKWIEGVRHLIEQGPIIVGYRLGFKGGENGIISVSFANRRYSVVSDT